MKNFLFLSILSSTILFGENFDSSNIQRVSFFSYSLPRCHLAYHWKTHLKYSQNSVELEDGSIWLLDPNEKSLLLRWTQEEPLAIIENHSWFSSYNFLLVNLVTNEAVGVTPSFGPILKGDYTHWITGIDPNNGYVLLEDNTNWQINRSDLPKLKKWLQEDTVIIGTNYSWSGEDYILINVNLNYQCIRANAI